MDADLGGTRFGNGGYALENVARTYGPNVGQENLARFNLPEFHKLFEHSRRLPDSPERTKLFDRMTEIAIAYAPWRVTLNNIEDTFAHRWVRYYVPHPIHSRGWAYMDVDEGEQMKVK